VKARLVAASLNFAKKGSRCFNPLDAEVTDAHKASKQKQNRPGVNRRAPTIGQQKAATGVEFGDGSPLWSEG
jgi:hypothetical protein